MRSELPEPRRVIEKCGDEDFDKFMAGTVKEVLLSEGYTSRQLEEAMTMGTVQTAFQRGLEEMVQGSPVQRMRSSSANQARSSSTACARVDGSPEPTLT